MFGRLLWPEPLDSEVRLYRVGETFIKAGGVRYRIERVAVADYIQHVNISVIEEDVIITEPYL